MSDSNRNRKELDAEINKIQISLDDNEKDSKDSFKWIDITSGIGRKALLMGITLVAINVFSGVFAMSTYTAEIFNDTGSNLSPNTSAIIVGVIQLFGSCAVTQFVDRCGRKVNIHFIQFNSIHAQCIFYQLILIVLILAFASDFNCWHSIWINSIWLIFDAQILEFKC